MWYALDKDTLLNNIHFSSTTAEFAARSELFSRGGRNPLRGCVSPIDGIALRIRRPRVCEVPNPSSNWTRKGFFAINVQAAVGGDYQVHFLSKVTAGSCHDSTAFSASGLAELLARDGGLPRVYWVAGDDAYIAGERLLTPWPGNNLPWEKDAYNYYHSSSRTYVEQAFGKIVGEPAVTHTAGVPAGRLAGSDKQAAGLAVDGEATGRGMAVATCGDTRHGGGADQTSQLALVGAHRALCQTRGGAREVQQGPRSYLVEVLDSVHLRDVGRSGLVVRAMHLSACPLRHEHVSFAVLTTNQMAVQPRKLAVLGRMAKTHLCVPHLFVPFNPFKWMDEDVQLSQAVPE